MDGCGGGGDGGGNDEEDNGMLFRMTGVHSAMSHLNASAAFVGLKSQCF